jgi:hypothetical protein
MEAPTTPTPDYRSILLSLDSQTIARRLTELHAEEDALRIIYRAVQARERAQRSHRQPRRGAHE